MSQYIIQSNADKPADKDLIADVQWNQSTASRTHNEQYNQHSQ